MNNQVAIATTARAGSAGLASQKQLLADEAYQRLSELLVRLEIMPGEQLNEAELSRKLGLGLSPIRGALRRLEFDKMVVIAPRSGTFAAEIALRSFRSISETRQPLEELAARLASNRGSAREKQELLELAHAQREAATLQSTIDFDAEFHRRIYAMTRNEYLAHTLNVYFNHALRQWYYCSKVVQAPAWSTVDNVPTASAILAGEADAAAQHMGEHVREDSEEVLAILTAYGL